MKLIEINEFKLELKMLGISFLDTMLLYTLAAIGVSTIVSKFYHSLELYLSLLSQNVEYYFPWFHQTISRWIPIPRQAKTSPKTQEQIENEVMDDILSKTKGYYHSINQILQTQIKNIPDPTLSQKLNQWYQTMNRMIENTDKSNVKDLKKRMSECADEIYKVLGVSNEVQKEQ